MTKELEAYDALISLLEGWASWQANYRPKLGYPSRSLSCYCEASTDFDEMCDEVDSQMFATIDVCVQDLPPAQRAAIMRRYGIAAVFRFPRDNYAEMLQAAHERLMVVLPRKGVEVCC